MFTTGRTGVTGNPRTAHPVTVTVEYTNHRAERVNRTFTCAYTARRFYTAKVKAKAQPTLTFQH